MGYDRLLQINEWTLRLSEVRRLCQMNLQQTLFCILSLRFSPHTHHFLLLLSGAIHLNSTATHLHHQPVTQLLLLLKYVSLSLVCSRCCYAHPATSLSPPSLHRFIIPSSLSLSDSSVATTITSVWTHGGFISLPLVLRAEAPKSQNLPVESKCQRLLSGLIFQTQ